jgi:hypothetical protein
VAYVKCFTLACQDSAEAEPPALTRPHPPALAMFHIRSLCESTHHSMLGLGAACALSCGKRLWGENNRHGAGPLAGLGGAV